VREVDISRLWLEIIYGNPWYKGQFGYIRYLGFLGFFNIRVFST